jgi:hypothetical protein
MSRRSLSSMLTQEYRNLNDHRDSKLLMRAFFLVWIAKARAPSRTTQCWPGEVHDDSLQTALAAEYILEKAYSFLKPEYATIYRTGSRRRHIMSAVSGTIVALLFESKQIL